MPTVDRELDRVPQTQPKNRRPSKRLAKASEIKWNEWWPFTRATGDALKQLNKRQPKEIIEYEEALL